MKIREALAKARPKSTQARRELSVSHEKLGDIALGGHDIVTAGKHYRWALEQRQLLAAAAPKNSLAQRDLAIAYGKLGEVSQGQGDRVAARDSYEKAREAFEGLAEAYPGDTQLRRDCATAYLKLGVIHHQLGEPAKARAYRLKALDVFERVAGAAPDSVPAQADLANCCGLCGLAERQAKDFAQAARHFERGIAVLRPLDLKGKLKELPQLQRALHDHQRQLEFCKAAERAIDDVEFAVAQRPLELAATLLTTRATVLADKGQHVQAAQTAEKLRGLGPQNANILYDVACCYALCVPGVAPGKPAEQLTAEEKDLQQKYGARALEALTEAVERGFKNVRQMETDSDLAAIRTASEYQQLVARLKGKQ
jgi:tetratricopeptide (TPR) repeat protein